MQKKQIEQIKKILTVKENDIMILRFRDEIVRIDKSGIHPAVIDVNIKDFTDRCQDQGHFERLKRHVLARITNNRQAPDFGFVYLTDVVDWHDTPDHKTVPGTIYILIPE